MPVYLVAYDLKTPSQNYNDLIDALERKPNCHPQGSHWFVEHAGDSQDLRDQLMRYLDHNDSLFVDEVSPRWASVNIVDCAKWLTARGL